MTRLRVSVLLLGIAVALAMVVTFPQAAASTERPPTLLQQGSAGPRVCALRWLLQGHRPSVFRGIATYPVKRKPPCFFGPVLADAVIEMKTRLGWPADKLEPIAGGDLFDILLGKRARPPVYVARASERLAADQKIVAQQASTACAERLIGFERSQIGVHEIPDGSNRGPRISFESDGIGPYQGATGAFGLAWCASFQAYSYRLTHIGFPNAWNGYLADSEEGAAGVFQIVRSAQARGWVRAVPQPAYLVGFLDGQGHIGLVERVFYSGILSIEGNSQNQVARRWHAFGSRPMVFIAIPGCATG